MRWEHFASIVACLSIMFGIVTFLKDHGVTGTALGMGCCNWGLRNLPTHLRTKPQASPRKASNALLGETVRRAFFLVFILPLLGCNHIPEHWHQAPKVVEVNGQNHLACEGLILVYSPSRNTASSSSKTYEIVFTDDYGQSQDIMDILSYSISDAPKDAHYAIAAFASPDNLSTAYSNGVPFKQGSVVEWGKNGDAGRAIWHGPGKWVPAPCQ